MVGKQGMCAKTCKKNAFKLVFKCLVLKYLGKQISALVVALLREMHPSLVIYAFNGPIIMADLTSPFKV